MNVDPKVEPWLCNLLEGVQNSNHNAEVVATAAYAAPVLVTALEGLIAAHDPIHKEAIATARAALALAGETP